MMAPKDLAICYVNVHPNATEREAIAFANRRYPDLPIEVAEFVSAWVDLHEGRTPSIFNGISRDVTERSGGVLAYARKH
jgi:hypothetical protein